MTFTKRRYSLIHRIDVEQRTFLLELKNIKMLEKYASTHNINKSQALNQLLNKIWMLDLQHVE